MPIWFSTGQSGNQSVPWSPVLTEDGWQFGHDYGLVPLPEQPGIYRLQLFVYDTFWLRQQQRLNEQLAIERAIRIAP